MPNLGPLLPKAGEVASVRIEELAASAASLVFSGAVVLNELGKKTGDGEQQNNMNAAAFVQQDF